MVHPSQKKGGAFILKGCRGPGRQTAAGIAPAARKWRMDRFGRGSKMKQSQQTTLRLSVSLSGLGVPSGDEAKVVLPPAESNHGIVFLRTGLPGGRERLIDARHLTVTATELCTVIGDRDTGAVATVEHLMSAVYGLGLDNVLVEID